MLRSDLVRRHLRFLTALATVLALASALLWLTYGPTTSAQTTGTGYSTCADGSVVFSGQTCGNAGFANCPGGALVAPGQPCPGVNGYGMGCVGAACGVGGSVCPGGVTVPVGKPCPGPSTQVCPGGVILSITQSCPAGYATCPGGAQVPLNSACPGSRAPVQPTCPNGEPVPPQGCSAVTPTPSPTPAPGATVKYAAGWNIVAGPTGTIVTGAADPLYTLKGTDSTYESVPATSALTAGAGYWAYFPAAATSTLPVASSGNVTVQLPAGAFVMIGNPGTTSATVTGADTVLVFSPSTNSFSQSTTLAPGQGAWATSNAGGQAVITNSPT